MPTEVFEFKASRLGSFLIAIGSVVFFAAGFVLWNQPQAPFELRAMMGLLGLGAIGVLGVVFYRLIVNPVMVRVSPDGLFIKNYDATIPWEALETARIINLEHAGEMIELVPKQPLYEVFATGKFALGKTANNLAGLPDYAYSMTGIRGSNQDVLRAISYYIPTG